jgi:hypothetical protein
MSSYGSILDDLDLDKEALYDIFIEYFDNPDMHKIKNQDNCSIYYCKLQTLLKNGNRYLIAICSQDNFKIGTILKLKEIKWICFQTRTLEEYHNIPKHIYEYKRGDPYKSKITVKDRQETRSEYICSTFPNLLVTLLHSKPNKYEYPENGTLAAALETYKTIFTFI